MSDRPFVEDAMRAIDRRDFLPRRYRRLSGADRPLPIGFNQTNSQPRTVAAMLLLLDVYPASIVLDVGAGSGWTTALLAYLTGPDGRVTGVELEPSLQAWGAQNLAQYDFAHATIRLAQDDVLGWPEGAPYDRILVSASARAFPQALFDQLAPDGVMVFVVGSTMMRTTRAASGRADTTQHGNYSFVPLRDHR